MKSIPIPSPQQLAWQRTETNLFIHFGLNTFTGREWGDGCEDPLIFNPGRLDCAQWARQARAGGFKIAILTAKHHDGFCLWPSKLTDHSVKSSPWRGGNGDLVREFTEAFRAEGIKVGLYLSPWDRHEKSYGTDQYNDFYCGQLAELLGGYGPLHEVWFDGACGEGKEGHRQAYDWNRYFAMVRQMQPGALTFGDGGTDIRWVGNERGVAGLECWSTIDPDLIRFPGDSGICQANDATASGEKERWLGEGHSPSPGSPRVWRPVECDVSIRPGWFYREEEDDKVRTSDNLVDLYFQSVGRNGTLLLNVPPTREGLFHENDARVISGFRQKLNQLFAVDLALDASVSASSHQEGRDPRRLVDGEPDSCWMAAADDKAPRVDLRFPAPRRVGIVRLQEAVQYGQRIAQYSVEVERESGEWTKVAAGSTVGRQKLDRIGPVTCLAVRVIIDKAYGEPALSSVGFFSGESE